MLSCGIQRKDETEQDMHLLTLYDDMVTSSDQMLLLQN